MKKQAAMPMANPIILMAEYTLFLEIFRKAMIR
jgi:hypothetical protein